MERITKKDEYGLKRNFENLAFAIVTQAVKDYISLYADSLEELDIVVNSDIEALEKFFKSNWCWYLCGADGDFLIKNSRKRAIKLFEQRKERERKKRDEKRRRERLFYE